MTFVRVSLHNQILFEITVAQTIWTDSASAGRYNDVAISFMDLAKPRPTVIVSAVQCWNKQ